MNENNHVMVAMYAKKIVIMHDDQSCENAFKNY